MNDCDNQPCKNGGVCRDLDGDYTCQCPSPYVGKQCQLSKHSTDQYSNNDAHGCTIDCIFPIFILYFIRCKKFHMNNFPECVSLMSQK